MKNTALLTVLMILALFQVSAADRIIENPPFSVGTHSNVNIFKVTLNEKETLLTMMISHSPTFWIRIDSDTYIRANGQKHIVKSAEGIELDKETYSDESGKTIFTLKFDPINPDTKHLDFIESDCEDCFKIWGVELQSNVLTNRQEIPQKIKDEAIIKEDGKPLEIPQLKAGNATFKGRFLGYVPDMNWTVNVYVNNPITSSQEELEVTIGEDGSFELQVPLITTMQVLFRNPIYNRYILLSPNKETTVYIDLQQRSCQESQYRVDRCAKSKYMYYGGANAEINNQMHDLDPSDYYHNTLYNQDAYKEIAGMTADQYKQYILGMVDDLSREFSQKGLTKKALEFAMMDLHFAAIYKLMFGDYELKDAYRRVHNLSREDGLAGYKDPEFDKNYYSFLKDFDINRNHSLYSEGFGNTVNMLGFLDRKRFRIFSLDDSQFRQLIESGSIAQEDLGIAETLRKQAWENWDKQSMQVYRESGVLFVQTLIDSGKLTGKYLTEANKSLALYADSKNNYPSLHESSIGLHIDLLQDRIFTSEELGAIYQSSFAKHNELMELSPELQEKEQKFYQKYAGEINAIHTKKDIEKSKAYLGDILGSTEGIVFDFLEIKSLGRKFEEYTPLTSMELSNLSKMKNPFYFDYLTQKNNQLLVLIEENKNKKGYNIHEAPEGSGDNFFSDLMKPFEGKVVLVDFWATWCSPCLRAMKQFEAAKKELQEKGVVFVYLTDESSPLGTWQNMIPDIQGEHFRMKYEQYNALKMKFEMNSIPTYLILNKKGEQIYFRVGFEGVDALKRILNGALAEE